MFRKIAKEFIGKTRYCTWKWPEAEKKILQEWLRKKESDPRLVVTGIESTPACHVGDNFMSEVTRMVVSCETINKKVKKEHLLMKRPLKGQEIGGVIRRSDHAFQNEADAYQIVLNAFEEFSKTKFSFPKCIHASKDTVILQDLAQDGFVLADRRVGLDLAHALLVVQELGKFHGASLAMKYCEPDEFSRVTALLDEFIYIPTYQPVFGEILEKFLKLSIVTLESSQNKLVLRPIITKLEAIRGTLFGKMFNILCPKEPLSVICHGDFYINNMLFRYHDDGTPEAVTFVDLQLCRYAPLATDLLHFFGSSLEKGLLAKHNETLISTYFISVEAQLDRMNVSGPYRKPITIDNIKADIKESALFGLANGLVLLPPLTSVNEETLSDVVDMNDCPPIETLVTRAPHYYNGRLEDLVITFNELGYL